MKIAVDFDGTIVEHRYPEIGKEVPFATVTLRKLIDRQDSSQCQTSFDDEDMS